MYTSQINLQPMDARRETVLQARGRNAYVALLYGEHIHFWLYALLLGNRLRKLDARTPRQLLVSLPHPDLPSPFLSGAFKECLLHLWQIRPVRLVQNAAADKTPSKRHQFCFTKLRALGLPFDRLIFFDLDVLLRQNPDQLFDVPAPAGMFHGQTAIKARLKHSRKIPKIAFGKHQNCINAGLMRLNPLKDKASRQKQVREMTLDAVRLTDYDSNYLPEQYYLFEKMRNWHHIDTKWNFEITVSWWREHLKRKADSRSVRRPTYRWVRADMPSDWLHIAANDMQDIGMLHFSGRYCQPWWFLHLTPDQAKTALQDHLGDRDALGVVPFAIAEWLLAIEELQQDFRRSQPENWNFFCNEMSKLKHKARTQNWTTFV